MINSLKDKVIIATTTLYSNSKSDIIRAELAKKTVKETAKFGYEILVVDGGSSENFLEEIKKRGAKVFQQTEKGIGNSRRQVNREAYQTQKEIVVWMEPEKHSFISDIEGAVQPILNAEADIIIPRRKSLKSLPKAQQHLEHFSNDYFRELSGLDFDVGSGFRLYKRSLAPYFFNYCGEYGGKWEILIIPVLKALRDGARVSSVDLNYSHDKSQTEIEEKDINFYRKRIEQLENFTSALDLYWAQQSKRFK